MCDVRYYELLLRFRCIDLDGLALKMDFKLGFVLIWWSELLIGE